MLEAVESCMPDIVEDNYAKQVMNNIIKVFFLVYFTREKTS